MTVKVRMRENIRYTNELIPVDESKLRAATAL